jgi:hypothetical protein
MMSRREGAVLMGNHQSALVLKTMMGYKIITMLAVVRI